MTEASLTWHRLPTRVLPGQGKMSLEQSLTSCVSHLTLKDISTSINV